MVSRVSFETGPALALVFGFREENLRQLETSLGVRVVARGNQVTVQGPHRSVEAATRVLERMREVRGPLSPDMVRAMADGRAEAKAAVGGKEGPGSPVRTPRQVIVPRGPRQEAYADAIRTSDVVFSIGPAGTGKTYLAVGCAVSALLSRSVDRIILARPVVEAGERLGFLPGDVQEKVNPYMRPLYDALQDMMDNSSLRRLLQEEVIEIAPLAYMRGRTLNKAFVILDEAQNTTIEQMKMFLTRLGVDSKAVVTGDITQVDLPRSVTSGLIDALGILKGVKGLAFVRFLPADVVRHELVARIIGKYEEASHKRAGEQGG